MNDQQLLRYARHLLLPSFDEPGQQRLLDASALVIGAGGLGCPAAMYLASSGVGRIVLVDFDRVELSNLQRQIGHATADLGRPKVDSLADTLRALNPEVAVEVVNAPADDGNLAGWLQGADVALDCSDNFATRFAINRACFAAGVPLVSAAAIRAEGQLSVFDPRRPDSPCYRCLYDDGAQAPQSCAQNGVLAPLVGVLGAMQALEAVKVLAGYGAPLVGRLQLYDARAGEWRSLRLPRDPGCPVCAGR